MLRSALPRGLGNLFDLMAVAEQEIKKAAEHYPARRDAISKAFIILEPTLGMTGMASAIYRHHAAELLDRVGRRQLHGAELGTAAEVMIALSEGSLRAPFKCNPQALYERLFNQVFPDAGVGLPGEGVRESFPGAAAELENKVRRKLADPARKAFVKETIKGQAQVLFESAA